MRILITGVHGFVGSNLVESLSANNTIYGLDIINPDRKGVVRTFSWDDLKSGEIPEVDVIIHLAGKAHDTKNEADKDVYFKVNLGLTQIIFDYFCESKISKFIFFSTAKAAAEKVNGILTEAVIPSPRGPYGESKIEAERYILDKMNDSPASFSDRGVYIFRPCMIHGPGNKGNLNLLYDMVSKGLPWPLGAFDNKRTFTSIGNVCFVIDGVINGNVPSGIYNLGDDDPISTNDLIRIICSSLNKTPHIWKISPRIMFFLAKVGSFLHLPLNMERFQKLTENYVSSNAKIKSALGVDKLPISAEKGLENTLEYFSSKERL